MFILSCLKKSKNLSERKKDIGERVRKTVMQIVTAKTMRKFSSKNGDLRNQANPASHMNTHVLQRKECQGEISET